MKRLTYLLLFVLMASMTYAQQAKYVFFFIGDGMGVNQVNTTEMFQAEMEMDVSVLRSFCLARFLLPVLLHLILLVIR